MKNIKNIQFNDNWKFILDNEVDGSVLDLKDSSWRNLSIPHDWSIEGTYDEINGDGATGYLTGGIGWYRKKFSIEYNKDKTFYIHFDGIYNNSTIWINGKLLGEHPYGYSPFYFDITNYLNRNISENLIAIKVDRTRYVDSRWYTGSGIYRDVELVVVDNIHIPIWGSFITTPMCNEKQAIINLLIDIKNNYNYSKVFTLFAIIYDSNGIKITENKADCVISANCQISTDLILSIQTPTLWSMDNPYLYKITYGLIVDDEIIENNDTNFGIRSFKFHKDLGFILNDQNIKIKGVCLHHDAGLVGAAVPKDVWKRRLLNLKDCGCNAIRISHNPASTVLLDLCDELGFLVQDEFFDEWDYPKDKRLNMNQKHNDYISMGYTEHFQKWSEFDLKNTILSHRNHPSIFQWSIGNEIEWTYPRNVEATGFFDTNANGNYFWNTPPNSIEEIRNRLKELPKEEYDIGETANKLSNWTKELDRTRPVIANSILPSVSFESGYTDALDIVGFSYRRVMYDYARKNYPNKICMGTENLAQWHDWKAIEDRNFISGTFLWTGIDYLGEAHRDKWPKKGTNSGLLDLAGFKKPSFYMFRSLWSNKASIRIFTQNIKDSLFKIDKSGEVVEKDKDSWKQLLWQWHNVNSHWSYKEAELIIVEVYSNCQEVELFFNNESLGKKSLENFSDNIYKWALPFSPGELKAVGKYNNTTVQHIIITPSVPSKILLFTDRVELSGNNRDCTHIVAQITDSENIPVETEEREIEFYINGKCRNLGVDNGSIYNVQKHKSNKVKSFNGRALIILQSTYETSNIKVIAKCKDFESEEISLKIK